MTKRHCHILIIHLLISCLLVAPKTIAQPLDLDHTNPTSYLVQEIRVTGTQTLDPEVITALVNIQPGDTVLLPGPIVADTIQRIWKQHLVKDVALYADQVAEGRIVLTIHITESPRLSDYTFIGVRKRTQKTLIEQTDLVKGKIVTQALLRDTQKKLQQYWIKKGYHSAKIQITSSPDPDLSDHIRLEINIDKGKKTAIHTVLFEGNRQLSSPLLSAQMKHIREKPRFTLIKDIIKQTINLHPIRPGGFLWRPIDIQNIGNYVKEHVILRPSRFDKSKFKEDQQQIIDCYRRHGLRDAIITDTEVYQHEPGYLNVKIKLEEGRKYHIGNIRWTGNYLHNDDTLNAILRIHPGDVYDSVLMQQRLNGHPDGQDVASLYKDNGYLFFYADPVEVGLTDNSVDIEIRIHEGPQAYIKQVLIEGNTITHDYVIRRELRTLPGEKFSKAKLIRSYRELAMLSLFDPAIDILPIPNWEDKTTDIKYKVKERPKFEIKASGSWGARRYGIILGLVLGLNNFSGRDFFRFKRWRPIGAGQEVNIKAEFNGKDYQNFALQFMEPWLGGRHPIALSVALNISSERSRTQKVVKAEEATTKDNGKHIDSSKTSDTLQKDTSNKKDTKEKTEKAHVSTKGARVNIATRLKWPDDYFRLYGGCAYYRRDYKNYDLFDKKEGLTGAVNDLNINLSLERNSVDNPIYPTRGSIVGLHTKFTPIPFSLLSDKDYGQLTTPERFKWTEYHQWMADASYFITLFDKLVFSTRGHFGILGGFSSKLGVGPFERFYLGGGGMPGHLSLLSEETISLRGYSEGSIAPKDEESGYKGGIIYDKFVLELRYPILSNPISTIYALTFAEGGNNWARYSDYNLFDLNRSAGIGLRVYLPFVLGTTFGLDWGYGFDDFDNDQNDRPKFHFSLGAKLR